MSRFLALGLSLEDIISRVTAVPAKQFGVEGLGMLEVGTPADISIFKLADKAVRFTDKFGSEVCGTQEFVPMGTMIGGELLYRSVDLNLVPTV